TTSPIISMPVQSIHGKKCNELYTHPPIPLNIGGAVVLEPERRVCPNLAGPLPPHWVHLPRAKTASPEGGRLVDAMQGVEKRVTGYSSGILFTERSPRWSQQPARKSVRESRR